MDHEFAVDRGALGADEIARLTADIWADLPFDEAAKAALRRDGLAIDGMRLTGANPFVFHPRGESEIAVAAPGRTDSAALVDLWRVHFAKAIRERAAHATTR